MKDQKADTLLKWQTALACSKPLRTVFEHTDMNGEDIALVASEAFFILANTASDLTKYNISWHDRIPIYYESLDAGHICLLWAICTHLLGLKTGIFDHCNIHRFALR